MKTIEPNTPAEQQHLKQAFDSGLPMECAAIGNFSETESNLGWCPVISGELYFLALRYRVKGAATVKTESPAVGWFSERELLAIMSAIICAGQNGTEERRAFTHAKRILHVIDENAD